MKILIDARPLLYQKTGIGYYLIQLLKRFLSDCGNHTYLSYGSGGFGRFVLSQTPGGEIDFLERARPIPFPFRKISRYYFQCFSSLRNKRMEPDLFWGPNFQGIFSDRFPTVITIHDMAHIHFPEFRDKRNTFLISGLPEHARRSARILADSQATRKDIVEFLGIHEDKVKVVYLGVDPDYFHPIREIDLLDSVKKTYGLSDRFLLFVGTLQPRKNIEGLIDAFRILCERDRSFTHDLVIAGCKGWEYSEIFDRISRYGLQDRVKWAGYVDYKDLPVLYTLADLFVLPSHYEGFGLPVLESMACGTPVVTSDVSSLPEVAGDAAVLVDPKSPDSIADGIGRVLSDSDLNKRLREMGIARAKEFTWEKCAAETMSTFEEVRGLRVGSGNS